MDKLKPHLGEGAIRLDVKTDDALPKVTVEEFRQRGEELILQARAGNQFAVIDSSGKILQVVGMNGRRVLPEVDNPLLRQFLEDEPSEISQESQWSK